MLAGDGSPQREASELLFWGRSLEKFGTPDVVGDQLY